MISSRNRGKILYENSAELDGIILVRANVQVLVVFGNKDFVG